MIGIAFVGRARGHWLIAKGVRADIEHKHSKQKSRTMRYGGVGVSRDHVGNKLLHAGAQVLQNPRRYNYAQHRFRRGVAVLKSGKRKSCGEA